MRSRATDRRIILSLLAALVVECLLLFWHLGLISFGSNSRVSSASVAGVVARSENDLRRRGVDSLVWEETRGDETVYYYDSVLTLSQSSALLKLDAGSEVELAENTLVTIEPREEVGSGEIRLRFMRGNLSARNPFSATKIHAPDFSVDVAAGSELQLRQTGEKDFEVRMVKGSAQVNGDKEGGGSFAAAPGKLLRFQNGRGVELKLDEGLKWIDPPQAKIYSHEPLREFVFQWQGEASEFRLQTSGAAEQVVALQTSQRSLRMMLPFGDHVAYLRSGNYSGEGLAFRVWRAPTLHLLMPLPRNRVRTDEMTFFMWTRVPEASRYVFKLKGDAHSLDEKLNANGFQNIFREEDDAEWGVWAVDREGFEIPPLYKYPIFIRHTPFEAPLLNSPKLRKPAKADEAKGAWLLREVMGLILPMAHADDGNKNKNENQDETFEVGKFEAVFSWQPVKGADLYVIEISESPDFRSPVVSKRVSRTEFVWKDFAGKNYFWRVAAGSRSGRMGVFSEPSPLSQEGGVEIRAKVEEPVGAPVSDVEAKNEPSNKIAAAEPPFPAKPLASTGSKVKNEQSPEEQAKGADVTGASEPTTNTPVERKIEPRRRRIFWRGGFGTLNAKESRTVTADLSGMKLASVAFEQDMLVQETSWWTLTVKYSRAKFTPESKAEYPFQDDITTQQGEVLWTSAYTDSPWGWGLSVAMLPKIQRESFEEVSASNAIFGGAHIRGRWNFSIGEYQLDLGVLGGEGFGYHTSHRLLFKPISDRILLGVSAENSYILRGSYNTMIIDGFLNLGFQF